VANAKACIVAGCRAAKINAALLPFDLDPNSPVAFDRDLALLWLEINRLIAAVGCVDELCGGREG
jgi:hypothetical protein